MEEKTSTKIIAGNIIHRMCNKGVYINRKGQNNWSNGGQNGNNNRWNNQHRSGNQYECSSVRMTHNYNPNLGKINYAAGQWSQFNCY